MDNYVFSKGYITFSTQVQKEKTSPEEAAQLRMQIHNLESEVKRLTEDLKRESREKLLQQAGRTQIKHFPFSMSHSSAYNSA